MVLGASVVESFLPMIKAPAKSTDEAMAIKAGGSNWPDVGSRTMIAPKNPTAVAHQRRQPTVSPKNGTAKMVIKSGAVKKMTVTMVKGICEIA